MWASLPPEVMTRLRGPAAPDGAGSWEHAVRELDGYRTLTDDYDGQGAKAPAPDTFDAAADLVRDLRRNGVPAPSSVVPGPNGSVNLEWDYADGVSASVEVTDPHEADVFLLAPGRQPEYWVLNRAATVRATRDPDAA